MKIVTKALNGILEDEKLTIFQSGFTWSDPMYSTKLANPSLSHRSFHHFIVTRLPNHYK